MTDHVSRCGGSSRCGSSRATQTAAGSAPAPSIHHGALLSDVLRASGLARVCCCGLDSF